MAYRRGIAVAAAAGAFFKVGFTDLALVQTGGTEPEQDRFFDAAPEFVTALAAWTGRNHAGQHRQRRTSQPVAAPPGARSCASGMAVQQHHRLPRTAGPHAQRHLSDIDAVHLKAILLHLWQRFRRQRPAPRGDRSASSLFPPLRQGHHLLLLLVFRSS